MSLTTICFYDGSLWQQLLPLTYLKPVAALRVGISTLAEAWQAALGAEEVVYATQPHLRMQWWGGCSLVPSASPSLHILGGLLPYPEVVRQVQALEPGQGLCLGDRLVAAYPQGMGSFDEEELRAQDLERIALDAEECLLARPWDLFQRAGRMIGFDMERVTQGQASQPISHTVGVLGGHRIFLAPGAKVEFSTLNATEGPIYIGPDAEVMEGCHVRGPFALGAHSTLKMGAKIYGGTSIGAHCKVGGEVSNVVFQDYSNKGHDGFLGNGAIGSWCNLGADTNCSNLKNTYDLVKVWSVGESRFVSTGLQFCGLIMGDHSKCGINTMFNTGTVVGAFCNIFGDGFPRVWIPSFSWGGASGMREHPLPMALQTARAVLARRGIELDALLHATIESLHHLTAGERPYGCSAVVNKG